MQVELRERDVGESVGLTIKLVFAHFVPLMVINGLFNLPQLALQLSVDETAAGAATPWALASWPLALVLGPLATGASMILVAGDFTGERTSLGRALGASLGALLPLIGVGLVTGVGVLLGTLLLIAPGVMALVAWFLASCAVVLERQSVFDAIGRSSRLTRGCRWPIFGFVLVLYLLLIGLGGVVGGVVAGLTGTDVESVGFEATIWLFGVFASLFMVVGPVVMYFNLRVRKEGFDVEALSSLVDEIGARAGAAAR